MVENQDIPTPELRWSFPPDIPTRNLLEPFDQHGSTALGCVLDNLVWLLERKEFHTWEAVMRQEQGLPLADLHRERLACLLNFNDDPAEHRVLFIDDLPRPAEPWYETFRKVVPRLLIELYRTADIRDPDMLEGWPRLVAALELHGEGLSLPVGVVWPVEVVPEELRHRLWLQSTFDCLGGLGQEPDLTLRVDDQKWRVEEFAIALRRHKESVAFLGLTLDKLLSVLILPEADLAPFVRLMRECVGVASLDEPLADCLER